MRNPFRRQPPEQALTVLSGRIQQAWLATRAAIPFPDLPEDGRPAHENAMEDPRVIAALQARETAFGWALSHIFGEAGTRYFAPSWMLHDLLDQIESGRVAFATGEDPA